MSGRAWAANFVAKMSSYRESSFSLNCWQKAGQVGLISTANDSGLFRMVLFVVLSSCLCCCCCLGPVLALEAKLCFFVGVRLSPSGCWVTFRLARDVEFMAGGGLGLCTVLVAQKTNEYFCSLEKRELLKALFCHWNVRVLFF